MAVQPAKPKPLSAGPACCENIAATMIGHFATRLEVEATKSGGALPASAIRALAERFLAEESQHFAPVFRRSYDDCSKAREARQFDSARRHPFDRILMKRFAQLFPPRTGDDGGKGVLSRRIIPGFNLAVDKMIGPMLYEQCQSKAQAILDRHRTGSNYNWDAIYADREAHALVNDVLAVVAHYFADFTKRRAWFMILVNSHLESPQPGADDEHWQLTEYSFSELMYALYTEMRALMESKPDKVRNRYGDHTFETLKAFLERL